MKKQFYVFAAIIVFAASAFAAIQSMDWKIADTYSVKFDGGDPSGEFKGLKGSISFDAANLKNSKFAVSIDVATINTGNGMKNTHAVSEKWLDAQKFPLITFTSKEITKTAAGFEAKGTLDMHGVQKEITLPFTFDKNVFAGSISVNRMDYNINTAEPNHGSQIMKIDIQVPVTK
ncbi:MAG: YceI family protein [Bacteroidia bacterium]